MRSKITSIVKWAFIAFYSVLFLNFVLNSIEAFTLTKPSPIGQNAPLRQIAITYPNMSYELMTSTLEAFSEHHGFALRLVDNAEKQFETTVRLFRGDIKFLGTWNKSQQSLDLFVFSSLREFVDDSIVSLSVNPLKQAMRAIKGTEIIEKKLRITPDPTEPLPSISSLKNARFNVPNGTHNQVRKLLKSFADKNDFAIRLSQTTSNQDNITASLYKDNLEIFLTAPFSINEIRVSCTPLVGLKTSTETINQLFSELKNTVEMIDGVKFEFK